jgi:hypothetical protein
LSAEEEALVEQMNHNQGRYKNWDKQKFLTDLTDSLQTAVEIELATIPIYLSAYYSINRTPEGFPKTAISRFADEAGALIMSVAVEEMLHLSLSSNVLYSLGGNPQLYGKAPASYPAFLPGHRQNQLVAKNNDTRNLPIPLARFSFSQLSHFLAIEYPAPKKAQAEPGNWDTIGQIYSYVRCLISSKWIEDSDFRVRNNQIKQQINSTEYSPNCIDTVYPAREFDDANRLPATKPGSAADVAEFASDEDSHAGAQQLLTISGCEEAMQAIATIDSQGEGFDHTKYDDPETKKELTHYYKFLTLQSQLTGYNHDYLKTAGTNNSNVASSPAPPQPAAVQFDDSDLESIVYPAPSNPAAVQFTDGRDELVNILSGLFQYMLIMIETTFAVPADKQKIYFNRSMHQSMIWVMDKFLKKLREIKTADGKNSLCGTFANIDLGERKDAFAKLKTMVNDFNKKYGKAEWYAGAGVGYYVNMIPDLPDVSAFWPDPTKGPITPNPLPKFLDQPSCEKDTGRAASTKARTNIVANGPYAGAPKWPLTPPKADELPKGAQRHACMGLNSCKNHGRTTENACAGQGFCSTALAYVASEGGAPPKPGDKHYYENLYQDHTCHVKNDCRHQGGCGLYGTQDELANPGHNECKSLGSCATPINAERFISDGDLRGNSVWLQARSVFASKVWPGLKAADSSLPDKPPEVPGPTNNPDLFRYGPTIGWIQNDNDGQGMTACGSSGMSGAGSCA